MAASAALASPGTSASSFLPLRTQIPCDATRRRRLLLPGHAKRFRGSCAVASLPDPPDESRPEYTPWLIAGLGNPGSKYHCTRHNVGFEMIDHICRAESISLNALQSKALIGIGSIGQVPIIFVKPQSYVKYSGESVGPLAAYYQVPLRHILLIYDEMSLPNGVLRVQKKCGHGRHNGSISLHLMQQGMTYIVNFQVPSHSNNAIGIGNPPGTMDTKAFLLQRFSNEERVQMDSALEQGVEAVRTLVLKDFSESVDRFNLLQKYKYHKV